ncbi:hypothetical protein GX618_00290 [Candidatus Dojkabacteria bacterium]|uniref:Cell division protein FtsL n=1 Tax=Candidatus Dojkabacteria bacterium TaxID=2099670 RepID=A0A847ERW3_9BACT|nr:hypothetical protein [Candidatus Dojkabacteria bacterium]
MIKKATFNNRIFSLLLLLSFVIFVLSQLIVNSILTPLGSKLESLNSEKEYLLEENRIISEEIAKNNSLRVIENLSDKKLKLSKEKVQTFVYIEDSTLVANN